VLGHLFRPNKERGVYKTTDGGKSWSNVKFIDEDTGFTDIVMDPKNSKTLYAASYQRRRTSWGFNGGGPDREFGKPPTPERRGHDFREVDFRKDCSAASDWM
jgi:hypothetical protein